MLGSLISVFTVFVKLFLVVTVIVIKTLLEIAYKIVCSFEKAISTPNEKDEEESVEEPAKV